MHTEKPTTTQVEIYDFPLSLSRPPWTHKFYSPANVSKICILQTGFLLYSHWPWVTIMEVNRDWDNLDKDSISHVLVILVMSVRSLQLVILVSPVYFDELLDFTSYKQR